MILYNVYNHLLNNAPVIDVPWLITFGQSRFLENVLTQTQPVIVDSGAFLLKKNPHRASAINRETYVQFLEEVIPEHLPVFNFDVIGDGEASIENWKWLRDRVPHEVVPIWHRGTDIAFLDWYAKETDYIGIGGLILNRGKGFQTIRKEQIDPIWSHLKQHWPIRIHALGMMTKWVLERYPWYSADSSNWTFTASHMKIRKGNNPYGSFNFSALKNMDSIMAAGAPSNILSVVDIMQYRRHSQLRYEAPDLTVQERLHDPEKLREWVIAMAHRTQFDTLKFQQSITDLWARRGVKWDES